MSYGFAKAGVEVLAGIDIDIECKDTYELNNPNSLFIYTDIIVLEVESLSGLANIDKNDDELIFIACSPCQYYTNIRTMRNKSHSSKNLLDHFRRFVDYYRPGYIVIENVPGIKTNKNSPLNEFTEFLTKSDYCYEDTILNFNDYGVPQNRRRYVLLATRLSNEIKMPEKTDKKLTVRDFIGEQNGFPKVEAGYTDSSDILKNVAQLTNVNIRRLKKTPVNGGTRLSWKDDPELQINAYRGKDNIFKDVYGRMFWDKPAPTITTRFNSISNGRFAHPEENRGLSLREGATLQTFPKSYRFKGSGVGSIARSIGNAVPPIAANKIAEAIITTSNNVDR